MAGTKIKGIQCRVTGKHPVTGIDRLPVMPGRLVYLPLMQAEALEVKGHVEIQKKDKPNEK
jgi:hypothetical protein